MKAIIAIAVAIAAIIGLIRAIGRRWFTTDAKKEKLMGQIREIENEMDNPDLDVGTDRYNQFNNKLQRLTKKYADICRNE